MGATVYLQVSGSKYRDGRPSKSNNNGGFAEVGEESIKESARTLLLLDFAFGLLWNGA